MRQTQKKSLRVFYSWQSDLPEQVNAQLIRSVLSEVTTAINEDDDLVTKMSVDEATRDLSGSPNIASAIFQKIIKADVFICDLTKVSEAKSLDGDTRKYCNPNVAIELGFAIRELDWDRIILVFNKAYGKLPDDLPFDAKGHRTSSYRCVPEFDGNKKTTAKCKNEIKNAKGTLREVLLTGVKAVLSNHPKRPRELEEESPESIKRKQDIKQLKRVFDWIHLGVMDEFFDRLSYTRLTLVGEWFRDGLATLVNSTTFHIHDAELMRLIKEFVSAWSRCFTYSDSMDVDQGGRWSFFSLPMDMFKSTDQERKYKYTGKQLQPTYAALHALLNYVRAHYLEINPNECGREALKAYQKQATLPF
jgi:hypothetical protein